MSYIDWCAAGPVACELLPCCYDAPIKEHNMAQISTHLNVKPYQVAVSTDPTLPMRKWNWHRGTVWAVSAKSAAYMVNKSGEITIDPKFPGAFKFPNGEYVCAGFGT